MNYGTGIYRDQFIPKHLKAEFGLRDPDDATSAQIKAAEQAMATQAMRQQDDSFQAASEKVYGMKEDYGNGISVLMMIYNGSDNPVTKRSLWGAHGAEPYKNQPDARIEPGQWSVFLWTRAGLLYGVVGTIQYNILGHNVPCTWQISVSAEAAENCRIWSQPWTDTAIREKSGHLTEMASDSDHGKTHMVRDQGYIRTFGETSQGTSPLMKFVITRSDIGYYD